MKAFYVVVASVFLATACGGSESGPDFVGAPGVQVQEIAVYQGVKHSLMGGDSGPNVPIVAGRDALVRVFATADDGYNGEPVLARLTFASPEGEREVFEEPLRGIARGLDEPSLDSTINFWVPGDAITPETHYRVELLQEASTADGENPQASFPVAAETVEPLGAVTATRDLEIVLVPVSVGGLTPDISSDQVERYRRGFLDQFPTTAVDISVRQEVEAGFSLTAGGGGWSQLLNDMSELRVRDGAESHVYYYGVFTPTPRFEQFCSGGCVLGLGFLPGVSDSFMRAAIGLGYTGEGSVDTMVHEIGHTHGREHAPCGVDYSDPSFPHQGAGLGSWGISMLTKELKSPYEYTDFMGYCADTWVSDYTYSALYTRMKAVDALRVDGQARTYGRYNVGVDGEIEPLSPITVDHAVSFDRLFRALDTDGSELEAEGLFVAYDHIEGGVLIVPEGFQNLQITSVGLNTLNR